MGEYIRNIRTRCNDKIGTCENLYYATYDGFNNNKDYRLADKKEFTMVDSGYRFRFPFPDEAEKDLLSEPNFDRGVLFKIPRCANIEICHTTVFSRINKVQDEINLDYGIEFDCPESEHKRKGLFLWNMAEYKPIEIVQQKRTAILKNGDELVTVARCPYCGSRSLLSKDEIIEMIKYVKENDAFRLEILEIALKGYNNVEHERC